MLSPLKTFNIRNKVLMAIISIGLICCSGMIGWTHARASVVSSANPNIAWNDDGTECIVLGPVSAHELSQEIWVTHSPYDLVTIDFRGPNYLVDETATSLFEGLPNLKEVKGTLNLSSIYYLNYLFRGCSKLESIENLQINETNNVYEADEMFYGCTSLKSIGGCFYLNHVSDTSFMFANCSLLQSIGGPIQLNSAINMSSMFENCSSLQSLTIQRDYLGTEPANGSVNSMFQNCFHLQNIDFGANGFCLTGINDMANMFYHCHSLVGDINLYRNAPGTETGVAASMDSMFAYCYNIQELSLEKLSNVGVQSAQYAFLSCWKLQVLNIRSWYDDGTFDDYGMFSNKTDLHDVVLSTSFVPSESSGFPYGTTSWYAQADAYTTTYPIRGHDSFEALQKKYPNTSIEYWLALYTDFDANGGEFITGDKTVHSLPKIYDEKIDAVTGAEMNRPGYVFEGWAYTRSATVPTINPLDPDTLPIAEKAPRTLYAVWKYIDRTITFHAGDGASWETQTVTGSGTNPIELPNSPTKQNYEFAGWSKAQGSQVADIVPGDAATIPSYADAALNYYAVWLEDTAVTFAVGASDAAFPDGTTSQTLYGREEETLRQPEQDPIRPNYRFLGWSDVKGATTPSVFPPYPTPTFHDAQKQYWAVWEVTTDTVTFYSNGGTWVDQTQEITVTGDDPNIVNVPSTNPVREGYDFIGYGATATSETVLIQPADIASWPTYGEALDKYYALWIPDATVRFYVNATDAEFPDTGSKFWQESGTLKETITVPPTNPTRPHYQFVGWATTSSAKDADLFPPYPTFDDAEGQYWAVWAPYQYTVTFDADGGLFPDTTDTKSFEGDAIETITLPNVPTRRGFVFKGWSRSETQQVVDIDPAQPSTWPTFEDAAKQYWAVWEEETLSVHFWSGDGTFSDGSKEIEIYGKSQAELVLPTNPTLEHFKFVGWATTQGAQTPVITPGQTEDLPDYIDASSNYYPVWRANTQVLFSAAPNGVFPDTGASTTTTEGSAEDTLVLPAQEPERTYFTFIGWATTEGATTPVIAPDQTEGLPTYKQALPTYYAVWQEDIETVTFQANGGAWEDASTQIAVSGKETALVDVPQKNPVRKGYDFVGWGATTTSTEILIDPASQSTYPVYHAALKTYYAIWVEDTTVIFDAGEDAVFLDTGKRYWQCSGTLTQRISRPPKSPTRDHFTFVGWSSKYDAVVPDLPDPLPTYQDAAGYYYAVWVPSPYTVTFYAMGGTFDDGGKQEVANGTALETLVLPNPPQQIGYTFVGWSTSQTSQKIAIDPADSSTWPTYENAAQTYWAVWKEDVVSTTFYAGDGTFSDGSKEKVTKGLSYSPLVLPSNPVREHYRFAGWAVTEGAEVPAIVPGQTENLPTNLDAAANYYPVWHEESKVYFSAQPNGLFPDGQGSVVYTEGSPNTALKLPATKPQRSDYRFDGWGTSLGSSTIVIAPDQTADLPTYDTAESTYYAVWTELDRTVTFDANGGTFEGDAQTTQETGIYSRTLDLPSAPTRAGFGFIGWALTRAAETPTIVPGDFQTYPNYKDAQDTYYAVWVADKTIVFDSNNGYFTDHTTRWEETGSQGVIIGLPENPTRDYHTFLGWSSSKTATTPEWPLNKPPRYENAARYYYAVWEADSEVVRFQANGGFFTHGQDTIAMTGEADSKIILPDAPTKEGYTFAGWAPSKEAKEPTIIPSDASTYPTYAQAMAEGGVYYAFWLGDKSVMFKSTIGEFEDHTKVEVMTGNLYDPIMVPDPAPTAKDMEFLGWSDQESAQEPNLPHPYPTYAEASEVWYAVWRHVKAHWVQDEHGLRYMDDDGNYLMGEWATIDGVAYYFQNDTYMADDGWLSIQGQRYYFYNDGAHATGWTVIDGQRYYFTADGVMQTGWLELDGQWHYLNSEGSMATGWLTLGGITYYMGDDGTRHSGRQYIDGAWYYFVPATGEMLCSAWLEEDGVRQYYGADGKRVSEGWLEKDGHWYFVDNDGNTIRSCWRYIDSAWYVFGPDAVMRTGWIWDEAYKNWFYCEDSGRMMSGCWYWVDSNWYGFWANGEMCTGWVWDNDYNNFFYCDPWSGAMYQGCWAWITDSWYGFWSNGEMCLGWIWDSGTDDWYYAEYTGKLVIGWREIKGVWYYFNSSSAMVVGWQLVGNTWYYFAASGAMQTGWVYINNYWYYFDMSGAMIHDKLVDGHWLRSDGRSW